MGNLLYRLGGLAARRSWAFVAAWVAIGAVVVLLVGRVGAETSDDLTLPGTDSQAATDLLESRFPPQQNGVSPIVFHTTTGKVTDDANKQAIEASHAAILQLPDVYSATDPFSQQGQAQVSKNGKTAFVPVLLDVDSSELTEEIASSVLDAAEPGRKAGMEVAAGGPIGNELSTPSTETSELVGLTAAMLILLLAFGSVVAMGMPIANAVVGLVVGLSLIGLLGHLVTVPSIAPTLATMIGLGVGIDYALFLVSRHRRQVHEGMDVRESIALATATSGSAIVYAAGTVIIALVALAVARIPLVTALGYSSAVAVATAALAAVTLLPALLSVAGTRIDAVRLPAALRSQEKDPGRGFWAGWARLVTGHPWLAVLGAFALLVPLLIPVRSLDLGQEDIGATPKSTTQRQAYDLMSSGFGPGYNGPLLIAVELGTPAAPSPEYESQLSQAQGLQKTLEQEQDQGTAESTELTQQSNALKKQQTALEQQQASLERQQTELEQQSDELAEEQAALESQAQALTGEAARLRVEEQALAAEQKTLVAEALRLAQRGGSPARAKALREREKQIERDQARLRAKERALTQQAIALAKQAVALAEESATLLQQKEDLEQEGSALQLQAANLQTQAANLQTQQAQLEGLQQQATTNQAQAEQLQAELTQELTQAGGDDRGTDTRIVTLQDALGSTPGVAIVSPPQINKSGTAATFSVIATTAPSAPPTADLVQTLRTYTIPQATAGTDVEAHVGGSTASNVDLAAEITERLTRVILVVILLSFLVLMAAYRSIIVPLQAALANVLAVSAAFGILTVVFQFGWGLSLIGVDTSSDSVPIASYVPLMMFAVLFGLSMDYQVFFLSQIEHQRALGADGRHAVSAGLAAGAPVIVAAALIMMAVFASFVLNGDPTVKQFGVGLSAGVALAATMVLSLAPAILVIVGEASWWLPKPLDRVLPHLDIEGAAERDAPVEVG